MEAGQRHGPMGGVLLIMMAEIREGEDGTREWRADEKRHREGGAAIEYADGGREWWKGGKRHRVDGPAKEIPGGSKCWYIDGEMHRMDGPALEYYNGDKYWFLHGKRHCVGGPAIGRTNGFKVWYLDGKIHSIDGRAVLWADGTGEWVIDGRDVRLPYSVILDAAWSLDIAIPYNLLVAASMPLTKGDDGIRQEEELIDLLVHAWSAGESGQILAKILLNPDPKVKKWSLSTARLGCDWHFLGQH